MLIICCSFSSLCWNKHTFSYHAAGAAERSSVANTGWSSSLSVGVGCHVLPCGGLRDHALGSAPPAAGPPTRNKRRLLRATSSVDPSCRATAAHSGIHPAREGNASTRMEPIASARFCASHTGADDALSYFTQPSIPGKKSKGSHLAWLWGPLL